MARARKRGKADGPGAVPTHVRRVICLAVAAVLSSSALAETGTTPVDYGISTIVSSDGGNNPPFSGINIGSFIGATTFYTAGYTGTRAVIANIEAGVTWNGHDTLSQGQVAQYFADPSITSQAGWSASTNTWTDRHATWVGHTLVGQGSQAYKPGIAYGATLWSGAIATSWNSAGVGSYSGNFNVSGASFTTPYYNAIVNGVNGLGTADVINSSWGSSGGQDGNDYFALAIDAMAFAGGKTVCFSAGNSGSATNTIGAPAAGFNALVVGATGPDTSNYSTIASFSSRSPTDVYDPSLGVTITGTRARVDIVAPGQNLTLAAYGGATGGNVFGGSTFGGSNLYYSQVAGTSFSSPFTAASAALVVDAGKALFAGDARAVDGRVIKAVLMNSAGKLSGWSNGQSAVGGVITTTQSLDYTQGAGQINLTQAYSQYTAGTTNLPGLGGGKVLSTGWDYGQVAVGGHVDYPISVSLAGGSTFAVTLDWFAHSVVDVGAFAAGYGAFDNLDVQVWYAPGGVPQTLVAQSTSKYNSAEHLYFSLPSAGNYLVRVVEAGFNWNGFNGITDTSTDFALAWNGTAYACVYTGASAGNWTTSARWSPTGLPGAGEDVTIASGATVTYDYSGTAITINSLTIDSGATLTQASLAFSTGSESIGGTATAGVAQSGGTHSILRELSLGANAGGNGAFTLSGSGTFSASAVYVGGTAAGAGGVGTLNINGGTASVSGTLLLWNAGSTVSLQGGMLTAGAFNMSGGNLSLGAGSVLTASGGVLVSGGSIGSTDVTGKIVGSLSYSSGAGSTYAGQLAGGLTYTGASASTFGKITNNGASASSVTVNNALAYLTLSATNTYTGATNVSSGILDVTGSIDGTSSVSVGTGAQAFFTNGLRNNAASLTIATGGKVTMRETPGTLASGWPGGANAAISVLGSLSLNGMAQLELANNDLVIDYATGNSPFITINDAVRSGYNGGAWNGLGIISSDAASLNYFTLLVLDTADGNASYAAISTDATSVVIKFTHQDDLNGDGLVSSLDKVIFTSHWIDGQTGATHRFGDMDFDGVYTFNDVQLFNLYFNTALPSLPEPGSLALLAIGAAGLLTRARR